jgi:hypothetical protein
MLLILLLILVMLVNFRGRGALPPLPHSPPVAILEEEEEEVAIDPLGEPRGV